MSNGFIETGASSAPLSRVRLPTGVEWVVAAASTKDENAHGVCNVGSSAQHANGTGSLVNCVSRFGAFDKIGNVLEWTDEMRTSTVNPEATLENMVWKRFLGTSAVTAFPSGAANGSVPSRINTASDAWIDTWNLLSGFPGSTGGNTLGGTSSRSYLWQATTGDKRAAFRGGLWDDGANAGRFALNLNYSPLDVDTDLGGRCALSPP